MNLFRVMFQAFLILVFFSGIYVIFWLDRYHESFKEGLATTTTSSTTTTKGSTTTSSTPTTTTSSTTTTKGSTTTTSTPTTTTASDSNDNQQVDDQQVDYTDYNPNMEVTYGNPIPTNAPDGTRWTDTFGMDWTWNANTNQWTMNDIPDGTVVRGIFGQDWTWNADTKKFTNNTSDGTVSVDNYGKKWTWNAKKQSWSMGDGRGPQWVGPMPGVLMNEDNNQGGWSNQQGRNNQQGGWSNQQGRNNQKIISYNDLQNATTLAPVDAVANGHITGYNQNALQQADKQLDDYILNKHPTDVLTKTSDDLRQASTNADFITDSAAYPGSGYAAYDPLTEDINHYEYVAKEFASSQPNGLSDNPMDPNWGGVMYTQNVIKSGKYNDNNITKPLLFQPKGVFLDSVPSRFGKPQDII